MNMHVIQQNGKNQAATDWILEKQ